jgi:hypothetical protein
LRGMTLHMYNTLWRKTSENLISNNVQYPTITEIVHRVTGYDTAIAAFNSGTLTTEHIAEIERLGMLESTTQ